MRTLFVLLLLSATAFSQQQNVSEPLTNQRIIELVRSGTDLTKLNRLIATAPQVNFDLTPAAEQKMIEAGVSEDTIKAMAAREQGATPGTATAIQPSTPMYQPGGQPVVQQPTQQPERTFRTDVFVGFSYLNVDTNNLTATRQSANGWEAAAAFSPNNGRFSIEGDFAGYYKNYNLNVPGLAANLSGHDYSFLGGPRASFGFGFVHALFGVDELTGAAVATYFGTPYSASASQSGFAMAFGGGFQSKPFMEHLAIRTSADYVISRHNLVGATGTFTQNNFRVSVGMVFVVRAKQSGTF